MDTNVRTDHIQGDEDLLQRQVEIEDVRDQSGPTQDQPQDASVGRKSHCDAVRDNEYHTD